MYLIAAGSAVVHLSFCDIGKAIKNIKKSGSQYLLVTNYPKVKVNFEISTGGWRPLNMQKPPFNYPEQIFSLEDSEEFGGPDWGKQLGLWEVQNIMLPSRTYLDPPGSVNVPGSYAMVLPALSCIETYPEPRLAFCEQPKYALDINYPSF